MCRRSAFISLICLLFFHSGTAVSQGVLHLPPEKLTLKAVFDAGIRPRHQKGLEKDVCTVQDVNFVINPAGKGEIPIEAVWANFGVRSDDSIGDFLARDRNKFTLSEILERASGVMELLGIEGRGFAEWEAEQRALIEEAKSLPGPFLGGQKFSASRSFGENNEMIFGITVRASFNEAAPYVLQYYARWKSKLPIKDEIRRTVITPPEGYEDFSMAPYPSSDDKNQVTPKSEAAKSDPEEEPEGVALRSDESVKEARAARRSNLPILSGVVIGLGILIGVFLRSREKKLNR